MGTMRKSRLASTKGIVRPGALWGSNETLNANTNMVGNAAQSRM